MFHILLAVQSDRIQNTEKLYYLQTDASNKTHSEWNIPSYPTIFFITAVYLIL